MLFPDGVPTTAAFFPRGREGKEEGRTSSPSSSPHSGLSPEECRERERGNETGSDSGGNCDFVSMLDSNPLPTAPSHYRFPEEPRNDNKVEVGREGNGLRFGGDERRREPFEMRRKLGRRGAESRIKEAAAAAAREEGPAEDEHEHGLRERMRMDERKAVRGKEDEDDNGDQETDHLFFGRQVGYQHDDNNKEGALPGVSAPSKRPERRAAMLIEKKQALQITPVNREPRPLALRRRLPLPPDNSQYCLPGWSGIRLGSSYASDRGRALVDEVDSVISSVSKVSMLATSGKKGYLKDATD